LLAPKLQAKVAIALRSCCRVRDGVALHRGTMPALWTSGSLLKLLADKRQRGVLGGTFGHALVQCRDARNRMPVEPEMIAWRQCCCLPIPHPAKAKPRANPGVSHSRGRAPSPSGRGGALSAMVSCSVPRSVGSVCRGRLRRKESPAGTLRWPEDLGRSCSCRPAMA
jgi:hypothetical protein